MKRALLPDPAARERLRRACEADLRVVTPVWVAGPCGAAMETTPPRFRDHGEEVAWWHKQHEKEQGR